MSRVPGPPPFSHISKVVTRLPVKIVTALLLTACSVAGSEEIGAVDTAFKLIGPDHKIVVDAYDDPRVAGVTCYVSRAKTGGIKGALGLAEDRSEASIACRQTGPIIFKKLRVVHMVDAKRNTL